MQQQQQQPPDYGAVATSDENAQDQSFDADNTYYLKDGATTQSRQERFRNLFVVAVPILVAVLIMGGAAWLLTRDFTHLYPGRGGDRTHGGSGGGHGGGGGGSVTTVTSHSEPVIEPSLPGSYTPPMPTPTKTTEDQPAGDDDSACAAHPNCAHLAGQCCPTGKGVILECCK